MHRYIWGSVGAICIGALVVVWVGNLVVRGKVWTREDIPGDRG